MPCVVAGLRAGACRHAPYVSRVCIHHIFSSPVAGVLQLLPYFGLASLPMVLGTVFFINCNCLRAFASSVFFLIVIDLACPCSPWFPLPFLENFYFGTECAILGGRSILGGPEGPGTLPCLGRHKVVLGGPPVGPVAAVVPSNYSFTDVNPGSHLFKCERFTFLLYLPADP